MPRSQLRWLRRPAISRLGKDQNEDENATDRLFIADLNNASVRIAFVSLLSLISEITIRRSEVVSSTRPRLT
jgi:hypothetical protein